MNPPDSNATPDLDTRVAIAEARLVARQEQLRLQWHGLCTRVEDAAQPRKLVVPALGAALGLIALWTLLRRPERHSGARVQHAPHPVVSHWARGLRWAALLLPLLPVHWRERLGPTVPSSQLGVVLPLVRRAWDGRDKGTPPQTVAAVDLQRYAGRWHQIARFPTHSDRRCVSQPTAEYRACAQGLTVVNRCRSADGRERVSRGLARVVPGSGGARLEVTYAPEWLRWLPFVWANHWILHVDGDYRIALAGTPARDALWLMSRLPEVSIEQFRELIGVARQQGYKLRDLRFS